MTSSRPGPQPTDTDRLREAMAALADSWEADPALNYSFRYVRDLRAALAAAPSPSAPAGEGTDTPAPVVLDLDDPFFHGQTLPDALRDYAHVHSVTGVCVKNTGTPVSPTPTEEADR